MVKRRWKSGSWRNLGAVLTWIAVIALSNACSMSAGAKGLNLLDSLRTSKEAKVADVKVENGAEADQVVITTKPKDLPYSHYKWVDPARVVIDLPEAKAAKALDNIKVNDSLIKNIEVTTLEPKEGEDAKKMVRVVINLNGDGQYSVDRKGADVVVTVKNDALSRDAQPMETAEQDPEPASSNDVETAAADPAAWSWDGPADDSSAPTTDPAPATDPAPITPDFAAAETPAGPPAKNLLAVKTTEQGDMVKVVMDTDGVVGDYSAFVLEDPERLVVDLWNVSNKADVHELLVNGQGIDKLRIGDYDNKLRLVFDVNSKLPHFRFDKGPNNLVVTFSENTDVASSSEISVETASDTSNAGNGNVEVAQAWDTGSGEDWPAPTPSPAPGSQPTTNAPGLDWGPVYTPPPDMSDKEVGIAYIDAARFEYTNEASTIILHADRPFRREYWTREDNEEEQVVTLFFQRSQVAADQQRSYDTKEFNGPIELFSVFQRPQKTNEMAVVIVLRDLAASKWQTFDNKFVIQFENYPGSLGVGGAAGTGTFGATAKGPGAESTALAYVGKTVSLDFKNMDILDALRVIADASGRNIVVADEVRGSITIKLNAVPWDQALDIILETKDLGKVENGNIIRIAKKATIAKEKAQEAARIEAEQKITPATTAIIPVNYLKAQDFRNLIQPLLTPGKGSANIDVRTNSIFVRDIPDVVDAVKVLVARLDQPTKQVLIEARIVEATVGVTRQIGVQWGLGTNIGPVTGTPTGLDFPSDIQIGGATLGGAVSPNLQAVSASSGGGALGMSIGHLTNVIDLDVLLKALESQRKIKIISSPRVLTLTDQTATITQGISIPYPPPPQSGGAAGGTVQGWIFQEAALRLEVTPRVSNTDNTVIMEVTASNNTPTTVPGAAAPGIMRKEAKTTILLKDGETAVIGGIFTITENRPVFQVPFLGNIPVIGKLFQDRLDETRNEELLIFLTPQIIKAGSRTGEPVAGLSP